jgi:double-strand break repair protein MRE11
LPIFSIHGNHDDPTRDGGSDMLAALDLLAVSNLVNYFGRQDEVDKVQVSPILIVKGNTKVSLYGMGSMRDERLNRMWQGKKVRFLRPVSEGKDNGDDSDEEDETEHWFNIFALHQNRDLGRGSKNCVHESMIPEWMGKFRRSILLRCDLFLYFSHVLTCLLFLNISFRSRCLGTRA